MLAIMNYKESTKILEKIKKADNILLNCHRGPDPDSIGSTLAMKLVLEQMGKSVDVICPTKSISKQTDYLTGYKEINLGADFYNFDYTIYDLFITLDTPNVSLLTGVDKSLDFNIPTVVIDHHYISLLKGEINILDDKATSVGEMVYLISEDWKVKLDKEIAECLLTAIIGDTGSFAYPHVTPKTLRIAADLMDLGADKNMIVTRIYRSENFHILKFWSEILEKMEIDNENRFVWAFIPYSTYKEYEHIEDVKAKSASLFAPIVEGTDFGFIAIEEAPNLMSISFRGRTDFDTSAIARELGGGGHKASSAVKIEGLDFDEAVEKVLTAVRKYAKKA